MGTDTSGPIGDQVTDVYECSADGAAFGLAPSTAGLARLALWTAEHEECAGTVRRIELPEPGEWSYRGAVYGEVRVLWTWSD